MRERGRARKKGGREVYIFRKNEVFLYAKVWHITRSLSPKMLDGSFSLCVGFQSTHTHVGKTDLHNTKAFDRANTPTHTPDFLWCQSSVPWTRNRLTGRCTDVVPARCLSTPIKPGYQTRSPWRLEGQPTIRRAPDPGTRPTIRPSTHTHTHTQRHTHRHTYSLYPDGHVSQQIEISSEQPMSTTHLYYMTGNVGIICRANDRL